MGRGQRTKEEGMESVRGMRGIAKLVGGGWRRRAVFFGDSQCVLCSALLDQNSIFRDHERMEILSAGLFMCSHCSLCSLSLFLLLFRVQILFKALSHTFKCLEIDTIRFGVTMFVHVAPCKLM